MNYRDKIQNTKYFHYGSAISIFMDLFVWLRNISMLQVINVLIREVYGDNPEIKGPNNSGEKE